jgi:hypothetical protein
VDWIFTFACAAYNLVRMRNLRLRFRRCKSGQKCAGSSLQWPPAWPKARKSNRSTSRKTKTKKKNILRINFSVAC